MLREDTTLRCYEKLRPLVTSRIFSKLLVTYFVFLFIASSLSADSLQHAGAQDYQLALKAREEGSFEEAQEFFEKAITVEPQNPEYRFELANLYAIQHDDSKKLGDQIGASRKMQQAADQLEQAVMAKPDFLAAHFNLGVVYKKLEKYELARKEFKEVLRLDPTQVSAKMQIAATYEEQGFYDEAETIYKDLKEEFPNRIEIQDALGGLQERREKSQAQEAMEHSMRMNNLASGFSQLSHNDRPYGYQDPTGKTSSTAGLQQAIPALGSWALQQFMKRKEGSSQT